MLKIACEMNSKHIGVLHSSIAKVVDPMILYCDKSGVVAQDKEPRNHRKGKHIEMKYHLVREIVQR